MNLFVVIQDNPFRVSSASANRWRGLLEGLQVFDVSIMLLIYGGFRSNEEREQLGVSGRIQSISYEYLDKNIYVGYWKVRYRSYLSNALSRKQLVRGLQKKISGENGVCWVDSTLFGFQLPSRLGRESGLKYFLEMSEYLDIYKGAKGSIFYKLNSRRKETYFNSKGFYEFDGIALISRALLEHYEAFPNPKPKFLHLPMTVDLSRFEKEYELLPGFEQPYIAFVGVLNNAKEGIDILIEAFNRIHNEFTEYKLYLVGPWHYDTPGHLELIETLGLENKVEWKGPFDRDDIPAIICNANLLVLPRPSSKQAKGGFPTKLGEYLATGRPVVATTVGEIPDYLSDNESVFFAKPDSIESLEHSMTKALADLNAAFEIGRKGKNVAKTSFNNEAQAKLLFRFLTQLSVD